MYSGKKGVAEKIFYGAMDLIHKNKTDGIKIFKKGIENTSLQLKLNLVE